MYDFSLQICSFWESRHFVGQLCWL